MNKTLLEMTDYGSEPIILKSDNVRFVVIPVFELDTVDDKGKPTQTLDSESMSQMFNQVMFNLEYEYSEK